MKETIYVLIIEDSEYYNSLLSRELKKIIASLPQRDHFRFVFHSFTDSLECVRKIKSSELAHNKTVAFIDFYIGHGINGAHIIRLLKRQNHNAKAVLISNSNNITGKDNLNIFDYFITKDAFAPSFCRVYLEHYLENYIS
ncbi:MAG: hypothetical protein JXB19_08120 [Bacteroidales bacterium]|nr:hypothetical protein [Bacteroidales bacterium]